MITINKKYVRKATIFVFGCFLALVIVTHDIWSMFIVLFLGVYLSNTKPKDKKEQEVEEELTWQSFGFAIALPAAIILIVLIFLFFWKLLPIIIQNI